ncbi:hypothetical protein E2C01_095624 [Portunus trituberculatus]|uniref:Uncharacterized protein n=1 Tax=Portunus trituberculatus TaxID=210409 RepID=A0A5B7K4I1_PORTR|nr:hypothetical protein [Portunus trituberculatus]
MDATHASGSTSPSLNVARPNAGLSLIPIAPNVLTPKYNLSPPIYGRRV